MDRQSEGKRAGLKLPRLPELVAAHFGLKCAGGILREEHASREPDMPAVSDNITVLCMGRDEIWKHVVDSIVTKRPATMELMSNLWPRAEEWWERVTTT